MVWSQRKKKWRTFYYIVIITLFVNTLILWLNQFRFVYLQCEIWLKQQKYVLYVIML